MQLFGDVFRYYLSFHLSAWILQISLLVGPNSIAGLIAMRFNLFTTVNDVIVKQNYDMNIPVYVRTVRIWFVYLLQNDGVTVP